MAPSTPAPTRFGHDFSRIPVHSKAPVKLQTKLKVNTLGDIYEQEADRLSEQVMGMAEPRLQRTCACGGGCPTCRNEQAADERLQTNHVEANDSGGLASPPIINEVLHSSGQPLDSSTRAFMEPRFGHDFSQVRVHADAQAAESARAVNALAYTVGHSVVFGAGRYAPATVVGRQLLAHELTHVIQQRGSPRPSPLKIGNPTHSHEREADAVAGNIESNLTPPRADVSAASTTLGVQRQVESDEETSSEEEAEAGAVLEGNESDADMLEVADSDLDEASEEDTDIVRTSESATEKTRGVAGLPPKKKKPASRRQKVHRTSNFWGRLTNIFGGKRGIYTKHWGWSWGKGASQREPSTRDTRLVVLKADEVEAIPPTGDSQITAHGALFYKGEPIDGITELSNFNSYAAISVPTPKPTLAWNERSTIISVTKTMTGTLQYKFGEADDQAAGPRARIVVERLDKITGLWVSIHDTTLSTTNGNWQTDTLNAELTPDTNYRVRVFAEYWKNTALPGYQWGDGRTQVDYSLNIQEQVETKVSITKTTAGKWKVIKKPHKFRLKL